MIVMSVGENAQIHGGQINAQLLCVVRKGTGLAGIKEDFVGLPQPVRFSGYLSAILDRVSVPLEDYDLIAGRAVVRELTDEEEEIFMPAPVNISKPEFDAITINTLSVNLASSGR